MITFENAKYIINQSYFDLIMRIRNIGLDDSEFMRMITVYVDITAPLYWWKEFDVYKLGTIVDGCNMIHEIHEKEFTLDDFSYECLKDLDEQTTCYYSNVKYIYNYRSIMNEIIEVLNNARELFLETNDKKYRDTIIQLLPSSYNQKHRVILSYDVLNNIYEFYKNDTLNEWKDFYKWIECIPYSELIVGNKEKEVENNG